MPPPVASKFPSPDNWNDFEKMVRDAMVIRWKTPDVHRVGRSGQAQDGIDLWGEPEYLRGGVCGVQCKMTDALDLRTIVGIVEEAESFRPVLTKLIVATTAPADARVQKATRELSEERRLAGNFAVEIVYYDEICQDLAASPAVLTKHFAGWPADLPISQPSPKPHDTTIQLAAQPLQLVMQARRALKDRWVVSVGCGGSFALLAYLTGALTGWLPLPIACLPLLVAIPVWLFILRHVLSMTTLVLTPESGALQYRWRGWTWKTVPLLPCRIVARLVERMATDHNGTHRRATAVALDHGTRTFEILQGFSEAEQQWIVDEVNNWMSAATARREGHRRSSDSGSLDLRVDQAFFSKAFQAVVAAVTLSNRSEEPNTVRGVSLLMNGREITPVNSPPDLAGPFLPPSRVRLPPWDSTSGMWYFGPGFGDGEPICLDGTTPAILTAMPVRGATISVPLMIVPLSERRGVEAR